VGNEGVDVPVCKVPLEFRDKQLVGCDVANEQTELVGLPDGVGGFRRRVRRSRVGKEVLMQLNEVVLRTSST
jgi:hypothetical protein